MDGVFFMAIGERLKQEREQKKMSLEEVQKATKIQVRYLKAIEEEKFEVMPGSFYVRAFIKEYATVLGLNPDELMEEYRNDLPFDQNEEQVQLSRVNTSKNTTSTKTPVVFSFMPTVIVVLLIIGIVVLVWLFKQGFFSGDDSNTNPVDNNNSAGESVVMNPSQDENGDGEGQEETPADDEGNEEEEETAEEEEQEPSTEISLDNYENNQATYQLTTNEEQVELTIQSSNQNWLQVEDAEGGNSFYADVLTEGTSPFELDISDLNELYLRFGEPQNITIEINGQEIQLPDDIQASQIQEAWISIEKE